MILETEAMRSGGGRIFGYGGPLARDIRGSSSASHKFGATPIKPGGDALPPGKFEGGGGAAAPARVHPSGGQLGGAERLGNHFHREFCGEQPQRSSSFATLAVSPR